MVIITGGLMSNISLFYFILGQLVFYVVSYLVLVWYMDRKEHKFNDSRGDRY